MKCQNCNNEFIIEEQDTAFYNRMKVPEPTFCPECRLVRRLIWKNDFWLYKRKCDLCNKDMISVHDKDEEFPVYCPPCWWSDKWDAIDYGISYDFSKPFFENYKELLKKVPRPGLDVDYLRAVNTTYTQYTGPMKNCYLIFNGEEAENCMYSRFIFSSKDSIDCTRVMRVNSCYHLFDCQDCFNTMFSVSCNDCIDVYFSKNCNNCSNCFSCNNLRHKKFHIFNEPYTKEEYNKKLKEFNLSSHKSISEITKKAHDFWLKFPNKYMHGTKNLNVTGDYIYNSKNVKDSFEVVGGENNRYCFISYVKSTADCYDFCDWGNGATFVYDSVNCGQNINNIKFCCGSWVGHDWDYCLTIYSCENVFGCVGLKNKQYSILNKQYTKEEYNEMIPKIKKHMDEQPYIDKKGRKYVYGEFFPFDLSCFGYNESSAQQYFPLTKEQAMEKGYKWKDREEKDIHGITDLPDNIQQVSDDITNQIILCEHKGSCDDQCTKAFKIIPQELAFYKKMNIPLPRLCPNCRHYQRIKHRNPIKLWDRQCHKCNKDIRTSYPPDKPDIVYCEDCYNKEVN